MASIKFQNVSKSFGSNKIIENINLTIKDGSFTVLVGPSGCGKTTLLRMIAGIGPQTSGRVLIDDKDMTNVEPGDRKVAMVFQNYAIYPTMTVAENIEFGLKNNKIPKDKRKQIVQEVSEKVGLSELLQRKPAALSGGQRQRIALARAISKNPQVFLMDEPLSNLDAKLRAAMRVELIELHRKLKTTFVYVTHDQVEAMSMADTIILMDKGKIMQEASPEEIYRNPANLFAACFIGSPSMNIIKLENGISVGFRPEDVILTETVTHEILSMAGNISTREMLGRETNYSVHSIFGHNITVTTPKEDYKVDQHVFINIEEKKLYFFAADGNRIYPEHSWICTNLKLERSRI